MATVEIDGLTCSVPGCGPGDDTFMCNVHWQMWKDRARAMSESVWSQGSYASRQRWEFIEEQGVVMSTCVWPLWT